MDDVVSKRGSGDKTEMWGIFRPHVREFLIFCFSYFKLVIVWSAGKKNYVHTIVDQLFADLKRPHVIWTFNDIEMLSNKDRTLIKPLSKLIDKVPGLSKYMSLSNSFILDDRNSVFEEPNPDNGIKIPAYNPSFKPESLRSDDSALPQLMNWFNRPEVIHSRDVRELDKSSIFDSENYHRN